LNSGFDTNGEKFFIDNLLHSLKMKKKGGVMFDIGANVGEYSQMIQHKSEGIGMTVDLHLFEPTKSCFSTISTKFKEMSAIKLNNFGVSDSDSVATIYYDKEQSGLASLYQRNLDCYDLELNKSEEIKLRRLDSYIEENSIKHIDFIKIDIEGHELKAFEGFGSYLNSEFIDYIQFEYGGANLDSHSSLMEIYKLLTDRGFQISKVMPNGLELREYSPFMDNFNYSNYVAVSNKIAI